jgi:hypothetical protein
MAADSDPTFSQAKRSIQTQLRSKLPGDRVAGLHKLKQYHDLDAAKMIVLLGLRDGDRDVRVAAFEALREYRDDAATCDFLMANVRKAVKSKEIPPGSDMLLAVLLSSDRKETAAELTILMEKQVATSTQGPELVIAAADGLGGHAEAGDLAPLKKLTQTELFQSNFAVRRAVTRAIMQIREPASIDFLIELLGKDKGEIRGDLVRYLTEISKQEYGLDADAWKKWWGSAKENFEFPPRKGRMVLAGNPEVMTSARYYGLPLYAQRLVFVFDISGSMAGERLMAAKRELIKAIEKLPENTSFGIIVFNSRVDMWQKKLVQATSTNRSAAVRFVMGLEVRDQTATFDAMAAALDFDAEAIYLLTDGAPTTGRIVAPPSIVNTLTRGNFSRRVTIHTIGIGVGPPGSIFDAFLSELAEQNDGQYRRVDE